MADPSTDRIRLLGLRVMARCGVLPEEVDRPQPFEIDVAIEVDLAVAGASDRLEDTVDYGTVVERIMETAGGHRRLMERFAEDVAAVTLAAAPAAVAVEVEIRKLRPPVPHDLRAAGVAIRRRAR